MIIKITDLCQSSNLWDVINEMDNVTIKPHDTDVYKFVSDVRIENQDCILLTQSETVTLIYDMTS